MKPKKPCFNYLSIRSSLSGSIRVNLNKPFRDITPTWDVFLFSFFSFPYRHIYSFFFFYSSIQFLSLFPIYEFFKIYPKNKGKHEVETWEMSSSSPVIDMIISSSEFYRWYHQNKDFVASSRCWCKTKVKLYQNYNSIGFSKSKVNLMKYALTIFIIMANLDDTIYEMSMSLNVE